MFRRTYLLALTITLASAASAGSFVIPHVLEKSGTIVDVGFDFNGGQPGLSIDEAGTGKSKKPQGIISVGTGFVLGMAAKSISGISMESEVVSLHRCIPGGGQIGGGRISFACNLITELVIPTLDTEAREAAYFTATMAMDKLTFDGFFNTTPLEKEAVKAQKTWLPSNFRVSLGDLPTSRVSKVDSFTIKQGTADADGDGLLDYECSPITLTIPVEDAGPFRSWFLGDPSVPRATYTLNVDARDNGTPGLPIITVQVTISSVGFADIFLGDNFSPGREVKVTLVQGKKGLNAVNVKLA